MGVMAQQTILVVEDDEAIAESVAYHLTRAGHRVLRAGDGAQGLRMFKAQRPDLVILDLMLPQLDGWRFTEEVRSEDQRVPVIVCSAPAWAGPPTRPESAWCCTWGSSSPANACRR